MYSEPAAIILCNKYLLTTYRYARSDLFPNNLHKWKKEKVQIMIGFQKLWRITWIPSYITTAFSFWQCYALVWSLWYLGSVKDLLQLNDGSAAALCRLREGSAGFRSGSTLALRWIRVLLGCSMASALCLHGGSSVGHGCSAGHPRWLHGGSELTSTSSKF